MGRTDKRAVKAVQDTKFPELEKEINTIAGYPIEFEVKWDELAYPDYAHMYDETFPEVYFIPVINAFKNIASDDMGKEALKETVKKIVIKNENDISSALRAYSLDNGALIIDHNPVVNAMNTDERSQELEKFLSSKM